MTRSTERLALVGSLGVLSVIVLTGATGVRRSLADARIEDLTTRLNALERRLASAEAGAWTPGATGLTVKAPFVVTDANNAPILTVKSDPRGLMITDAGRQVAVAATSLRNGGFLKVMTADQGRVGVLQALDGAVALELRDGPTEDRIALTVPKTGKAEVAVMNEAHSPAVLLSHHPGGGGIVNLMDDSSNTLVTASVLPGGGFVKTLNKDGSRVALLGIDGKNAFISLRDGLRTPRATLAVTPDGKPSLVLMNSAHINVFTITQGAVEDGLFQISDASGKPMVEGGVLDGVLGILRVGPRFNCGGKMGLIVSDCILGHK